MIGAGADVTANEFAARKFDELEDHITQLHASSLALDIIHDHVFSMSRSNMATDRAKEQGLSVGRQRVFIVSEDDDFAYCWLRSKIVTWTQDLLDFYVAASDEIADRQTRERQAS